MLKILQVHNAYREPGGEDAVVRGEAALLRRDRFSDTARKVHCGQFNESNALQSLLSVYAAAADMASSS